MSSQDRGPTIAVALNRRVTLKPLRRMNGDDLVSLMRHTRDNRAEARRERKSYEGVTVAEMNRQLRAQYREHRRNLESVRRQQENVYETMAQLADIKKRLGIMDSVSKSSAAQSRASTAALRTDQSAAEGAGNESTPNGGIPARALEQREAKDTGPLCPLLRHAVDKALKDSGSGSPGDGAPQGSAGGGDSAAAASAALAAKSLFPSPAEKASRAGARSMTSPIREALRRFESDSFLTAGFSRPRNLPPIDEVETYAGQRAKAAAVSQTAARSNADEPMASVAVPAATRISGSANDARNSQPPDGVVRRGLVAALSREDIKRILDSEPCPVHRLTETGGFEADPHGYVRRTFKLTPEHNHLAEVKRAQMLELCKQSRRKQASQASEFFRNLFPEQDAAVIPLEESRTPTPPPQQKNVRPRLNHAAASSLAECGYLRQYVRPSARPRILTPVTSWKQRS